eukprot:SAG31_NODE_31420_length_368_cov_0.959108_1_plen_29_part_01
MQIKWAQLAVEMEHRCGLSYNLIGFGFAV